MITVRFSRVYSIPKEITTNKRKAISKAYELFDEELEYIQANDFSDSIVEDDIINEIKKIVKHEIKSIKDYIYKRAKKYDKNVKINDSNLYDIDMDKDPIALYDHEDLFNHSFEIGGLHQLEYIKELIDE